MNTLHLTDEQLKSLMFLWIDVGVLTPEQFQWCVDNDVKVCIIV
jgi:hypothetical protein